MNDCKGRLSTTTEPANGDILIERGEHNHLPDPARVEVKKLHERLSEQAESSQQPPRAILHPETISLSQEATVQVHSNKNLAAFISQRKKDISQRPRGP